MGAMLALQGKLLARAAEICGGWNALCIRLGVEAHSMKLWVDGKAGLPERVFLKAADIVLDDDIARAAQDRRVGPRLPDEAKPQTLTTARGVL
jgi:hypothetical protein